MAGAMCQSGFMWSAPITTLEAFSVPFKAHWVALRCHPVLMSRALRMQVLRGNDLSEGS